MPSKLFDTERRLNAVLDNASVSVFLMDDRQRCVYMNAAAEKLTGFSLQEVVARDCPLHDIIHHTYPDGTPFPLDECAIDRAFPENNQETGEEVFVHRDGSFYPVAFTASPVRDDAANIIGTIIEVRNIAEEKAARERQRILIDELNHRVKNTLATVQSIARQTFRGSGASEEMAAFEARLIALATAHNVLTDSQWTKADLRSVADRTLGVHATKGGDRVTISGPDAPLHPKAAVTLAMALHELMVNATKYGALSSAEGSVSLTWDVYKDPEARPQLRLTWRESGGPPVRMPQQRGFGMRLIERQLPLEFGGSATFAFLEAGLRCELDLPLMKPGWQGQEALQPSPQP